MRTLFNLWLARRQAAFLVRSSDIITRLLSPLLPRVAIPGGVRRAHPTSGHPEHHHGAEEHAVPAIWLLAPRTTLAIWVMAGGVALAHHFHLRRHSGTVLVMGVDQSRRQPATVGLRSTAVGAQGHVSGR